MGKDLEHVLHAGIGGAVLCFVMCAMGQSKEMACSRSILIAAVALVYMMLFGHSFPPGNLNPSLGL
jgi:hypothetical protein